MTTFKKLIPPHIGNGSFFKGLVKDVKPSCGSLCVFVGLNASNEELGLRAQNTWAFGSNDMGGSLFDGYMDTEGRDAIMAKEPPLLFLSFPSAKDPNWKNHPGRENKSTVALITMSNYEWYKEYAGTTLHKRGDGYEELKAALGDALLEFACKLYPKGRTRTGLNAVAVINEKQVQITAWVGTRALSLSLSWAAPHKGRRAAK